MRLLTLVLVLALALPAWAQEEDQSRLTTFIEDQLSEGSVRQIDIQGFRGVLSSEAELDRLSISDDQGVWLVLEGAVLDWTRSALLSRELRVDVLSAERLQIIRPPQDQPQRGPRQAAAEPFSLPELPVAITLGEFRIDRVELGEAFLGEPVAFRVEGSADLEDGAGDARLTLERLDGAEGRFALAASFSNETRQLALSLEVEEAAGGLAADLLDIPGRPSIALSVAGDGPISDFTADIALATDGQERLSGSVEIVEDGGDRTYLADLSGDISPLVAPEIAAFFGDEVALSVAAEQTADGRVDLSDLTLSTADLTLTGAVTIGADGLPTFVDLTGDLGRADGSPVRLPVSGQEAFVDRADLTVDFDASEGETWQASFDATGFTSQMADLDRLTLDADGIIRQTGGDASRAEVTGDVVLEAAGLDLDDADVQRALGETLRLAASVDWIQGDPLTLSDLALTSETLTLAADATIGGGVEDLGVTLDASLEVGDLAAFSGLAGAPLGGAVATTLAGDIRPLEGGFDLRLAGTGTDLDLGQSGTADVFAGETTFVVEARRDETGIVLRSADIQAAGFSFDGTASATGAGEALRIEVDAAIAAADLGVFSAFTGTPLEGAVDVTATGFVRPRALEFDLVVDGTATDIVYGAGDDRLDLPGQTRLDIDAARIGDTLEVERATLVGPGLDLTADATTRDDGTGAVDFSVDLILDELSRLSGIAGADLGGRVDVVAEGTLTPGTGDLEATVTGTATDLQLGGDLGRQVLAGETTLDLAIARQDGLLSLPRIDVAGPGLTLTGTLDSARQDGAVRYDARIDGRVDSIAPFSDLADLDLSGAIEVAGRVAVTPQTGAFDVDVSGSATDLAVGIDQADELLTGTTTFDIDATRADGVLTVEAARIEGPRLRLVADATTTDAGRYAGDIDLSVETLAPFAGLVGRDLAGALTAAGTFEIDPETLDGAVDLSGEAQDLRIGDPAIDPLLAGQIAFAIDAVRAGGAPTIRSLTVDAPLLSLQAEAQATALDPSATFSGRIDLTAADLAPFSDLAGLPLGGELELAGTFEAIPATLEGAIDVAGTATDLQIGDPETGGLFEGETTFAIDATRRDEVLTVEEAEIAGPALSLTADVETTGSGEATTYAGNLDLSVPSLAPFSGLAGLQLGGAVEADGTFRIAPATLDGSVDLTGTATDLAIGDPEVADLLAGETTFAIDASREDGVLSVERAEITGPALSLTADVETTGSGEATTYAGNLDLSVPSLAPFSGLAGLQLGGAVEAEGTFQATPGAGDVAVDLAGSATDLRLGDPATADLLRGITRFEVDAARTDGALTVERAAIEGPGIALTATAETVGTAYVGDIDLQLADIAVFSDLAGLPLAGAIDAGGDVRFDPETGDAALDLIGTATDLRVGDPRTADLFRGQTAFAVEAAREDGVITLESARIDAAGATLNASATPTGSGDTLALDARLSVADLAALSQIAGQPLGGSVTVTANGTVTPSVLGYDVRVDAVGEDLRLGPEVTGEIFPGTTRLEADLVGTGMDLSIRSLTLNGALIDASLRGDLSGGGAGATGTVRIADIGALTDALSGPITSDLTVRRNPGGVITLQSSNSGPGGLQVAVNGDLGLPGGAVDLSITGTAPLGLADPFLGPRTLSGTARLDLALSGQPGLDALSGTVSVADGRLSIPQIQNAVEDISATIAIRGGGLDVDIAGALATGGRIVGAGRIGLGGGLPADLTFRASDLRLVDPQLYEAQVAAAEATLSGALAGTARLSGRIVLGTVEVRIPSAGLGAAEPIPEIVHLRESPAELLTRERAGLLDDGSGLGPPPPPPAGPGGGQRVALDLTVEAPNRIFVRGRGLDAELGGSLELVGTLRDPIPAGRFELLRGRLSILGRRLDLTEGFITLQGDFVPFLRLVASSDVDDLTVRVVVEGPLTDPDVSFLSIPSLPEDEILARFFFGRNVSDLSAFQALQLANGIAELSGRGGAGLLLGLREGLGLDDLDIQTGEDGGAAVRAGRYITENVYTDVTIGSTGAAEISINVDLTPALTARGVVDSDGESTIGVYFERDY